MKELLPDEKRLASLTFADVIRATAPNFPDPRFRPKNGFIEPSPFGIATNADGIGTKAELAERLYAQSTAEKQPDASVFEGLAFDVFAMVEGDAYRDGYFLVGVTNTLDPNTASDTHVINALAQGVKAACDRGHFSLLNGETAELGYRSSGYGNIHINWNAVGVSIVNPEKVLSGERLAPGQPVVALRETSIRSNGLTKARAILEAGYLDSLGYPTKDGYIAGRFSDHGIIFSHKEIEGVSDILKHDVREQVLSPWHDVFPDVTRQLLTPSRLYGPLLYAARGGVDGKPHVDIITAAHITGGGIPEKGKRMVSKKGLGLALDSVFPDPEAITSLLRVKNQLPDELQQKIDLDDQIACEHWNRGIGFLVVTPDEKEAQNFIDLATAMNYDAAVAGEITDKPELTFRGHTWTYNPTPTP